MKTFIDTLGPFVQNPDVQRALALVGVKSVLILLLAALAAWALREASAARRHLVWAMALGGVLLLPVLELALPAWRVGLMEASPAAFFAPRDIVEAPSAPEAFDLVYDGPAMGDAVMAPAPPAPPEAFAAASPRAYPAFGLLGLLWLAGAAAVGLYYLVGLLRLNAWTGNAEPVEEGPVRQAAHDVVWELDVNRPVALRWTRDAVTPLTFGVLKPVVLLPTAAAAWDEERLRVVLLHEFAHIRRLDALTQTLAQVACALFWFNPLVWWGAHRLRVERERACDDYVLARGTRASAYAAHLLDIARTLRARTPIGAVSMAHRGELEGRLLAILEPERRREILSRAVTGAAALAFAVVLLPLAAFKPWNVQAQPLTATFEVPGIADIEVPEIADSDVPAIADIEGMDEAPFGADETIHRTFAVKPGGLVDLETDLGSIVVETGSGDEVEVEVEHNVEGFSVHFDQKGNTVRVRGERESRSGWDWGRNRRASFRVRVPERFNARLETSGGSISVGDLEGEVAVRTSGGSLRFGHIRGRVRGNTSGGSITLDGTTGDVDVETSGGSIRLGDVGGTVRAHTSGGSITISEVGGDVSAQTSGGSITASITRQPRGQCRLETSGGSIRVAVAEGVGLDLDARTSGGRVRSDFHPDHDRDRRHSGSDALQGEIGRGGPTLYLRTSAGGIHVTRGSYSSGHVAPRAGGFSYSYSFSTEAQQAAVERAQALQEAAQDRAEALQEAAQERAEAIREAQQERAEAIREAQQEHAQALREAEIERATADMGESLSSIVGMALEEAFAALGEVDWQGEMQQALSDMSDDDLAEIQQALEQARDELQEAQRDLAEARVSKDDVRRQLDEALGEAERALRQAQRERQRRNDKGPK